MARPRPPLREAFDKRYAVDASTQCWNWTGSKGGGYGVYQLGKFRDYQGVYRRKRIYAHRLSWELFRGDITPGLEVAHRCDNPNCVNPDHLFLATHYENMHDRDFKKRNAYGESHGQARLLEWQVREIMASSETAKDVAARLGIQWTSVNDVRTGRTWAHLGLERSDDPKANQSGAGSQNSAAKLEEDDIRAIRRLYDRGQSSGRIALAFGVNERMIRYIIERKSWKHVT